MATPRGLESVVAGLRMFQGLSPAYIELVTGCASNVRMAQGEVLFRQGEKADRFFAIRDGRVAVEIFVPQRGPVTIQTVGQGEVLNWSWLFPPHENQFDARCLTPVRALAFDGACLRGKCEENHDLGYEFMKRFALLIVTRLRATRLQLLDVYGDS